MDDQRIWVFLGVGHPADHGAPLRGSRVAGGGKHHIHRRGLRPAEGPVGEGTGGRCGHQLEKIFVKTGKDRLRLRVSHAAVELEDLGPVVGEDQPDVEEPAIQDVVDGEGAEDGLDRGDDRAVDEIVRQVVDR